MRFFTGVEVQITGNHKEKSGSGKAQVEWHLEMEAREWGVKSFMITVPDQKITLMVDRYNEETDEEYEEEVTIDVVGCKTEFDDCKINTTVVAPTRLEKYYDKFELLFY